jgi:hypothetical protein
MPRMNITRSTLISTGLLLYACLIVLACTLSSEPAPTIIPRATDTPPPTIGYQTLAPNQLPTAAVTIAPRVDARLINLINQVEQDRLFLHINALQNFSTRHVNSALGQPNYGIGAAYNYIRGQFEQIRQASQGTFVVANDHVFPIEWGGIASEGRNIVGVIPGTETGAGIVLIGAHYDTISIDLEDGDAYAPGANDNGSGIAAMIEIARIMSSRQHRATMMFVAFSAEEIGRLGSIEFVNNYLLDNNIRIDAMLNLDIIGSSTSPEGAINDREIRLFSADDPSLSDPANSSSRQLARALQMIARRHAPDMAIVVQPSGDREGRYSDHLSFSDVGYPAVRFIEINEDFNRQHNDRDTIEDIQALYLTRATQTVLACATALADGIRPPANVQLRDEGGGFRTLVWERRDEALSYVVALRGVGSNTFNEVFEVAETFVRWDGFVPSRFSAVAVAAIDDDGLMGPFSFEYQILN